MTRILSSLIGAVSMIAALWILSRGAPADWFQWSLEQQLMPVVVLVTVMSGHLANHAARQRRPMGALGFGLVFTLGLTLTILTSVVRQTSSTETASLAIADKNRQRALEAETWVRMRDSLFAAQIQLSDCAPSDQRCLTATRALVKGFEKTLEDAKQRMTDLGSPVASDAVGSAVERVVSAFDFDGPKARRWVEVVWPFGWSLFLEISSVVAFGYAFTPSAQPRPNPLAQPPGPTPAQPRPNPEHGALVSAGPTPAQPRPNPGPTPSAQPMGGGGRPNLPNVEDLIDDLQTELSGPTLLPRLMDIAVEGEILTTQEQLAAQLKLSSRKKVRVLLQALELAGHITIKTSHAGTSIRINAQRPSEIYK